MLASAMFVGCISSSNNKNSEKKVDKFEEISVGDDEKKFTNLFGAGEVNSETYPGFKYRVLSYNEMNGEPYIFFTIDPKSNRIVGKAKWVAKKKVPSPESKNLLIAEFKGVSFKAYTPCRTRSGNDKILVNSDLGLYLATEDDHVLLKSYVTKKLLDLRVKLIQESCPNLQ